MDLVFVFFFISWLSAIWRCVKKSWSSKNSVCDESQLFFLPSPIIIIYKIMQRRMLQPLYRTEVVVLPFSRSEEPVTSNMDISTGHIVLVSTNIYLSIFVYFGCSCGQGGELAILDIWEFFHGLLNLLWGCGWILKLCLHYIQIYFLFWIYDLE